MKENEGRLLEEEQYSNTLNKRIDTLEYIQILRKGKIKYYQRQIKDLYELKTMMETFIKTIEGKENANEQLLKWTNDSLSKQIESSDKLNKKFDSMRETYIDPISYIGARGSR